MQASETIRALEALGAELLLRERQTLRLTKSGWTYAAAIQEALSRIGNATLWCCCPSRARKKLDTSKNYWRVAS